MTGQQLPLPFKNSLIPGAILNHSRLIAGCAYIKLTNPRSAPDANTPILDEPPVTIGPVTGWRPEKITTDGVDDYVLGFSAIEPRDLKGYLTTQNDFYIWGNRYYEIDIAIHQDEAA